MLNFVQNSVPLKRVAEVYLTRYWDLLVHAAGSEHFATILLNAPRPDRCPEFWPERLSPDARMRLWQQAHELFVKIVDAFRTSELLAYGYTGDSCGRQPVPGDNTDLWPRFLGGLIAGHRSTIEYRDVVVVHRDDLWSLKKQQLRLAIDELGCATASGQPLDKQFRYDLHKRLPFLQRKLIDVLIPYFSGRAAGRPPSSKR